jgi:aryl-alcohol dehydrogenase-like predicted oxidoreductase
METRELGKSGLKVAPLALGTNVFGWTVDEPILPGHAQHFRDLK